MGRPGSCCMFNLAKLDPTTGAIIWTRLVPGDKSIKLPLLVSLEPLRGTNHVLAQTQRNAAGSQGLALGTLNRVENTAGNTEWWMNNAGPSYTSVNVVEGSFRILGDPHSNRGLFGADGTHIVVAGDDGYSFGTDYDGNVIWANAAARTLFSGLPWVYATSASSFLN